MAEESASSQPRCCSFCGKSATEVEYLVAGPQVYICDECTELCLDIIKEERQRKERQKGDALTQIAHLLQNRSNDLDGILSFYREPRVNTSPTYCSFCGKNSREVKRMLRNTSGEAHICDECIELCADIVKTEPPQANVSGAPLHCSFCNRDHYHPEVTKLIAGPTTFICNNCVTTAVTLLQTPAEGRGFTLLTTPAPALPPT